MIIKLVRHILMIHPLDASLSPNLLIISNKNKKNIGFVTRMKQNSYLCGKFYSYETSGDGKVVVYVSCNSNGFTQH